MADPLEGVSPAGMIVTGASRTRVTAEYEPVLASACDGIAELDPDASLYLYGSVATGTAEPPRSDLDLLTIGLESTLAIELAGRLSHGHEHLCRAVEIAPMTQVDGESDESYGNRVFLRHYCIHIQGPTRHAGLGEYPADARAARGFNGDVARHTERWQAGLRSGDEAAQIGRRAARKVLLALAGIVSIADRTWTTDRAVAVARWAPRHPRWATEAATLTAWATGNVAPDAPAVEQALDGVIAEIVDQFSELIGLWDSR